MPKGIKEGHGSGRSAKSQRKVDAKRERRRKKKRQGGKRLGSKVPSYRWRGR